MNNLLFLGNVTKRTGVAPLNQTPLLIISMDDSAETIKTFFKKILINLTIKIISEIFW